LAASVSTNGFGARRREHDAGNGSMKRILCSLRVAALPLDGALAQTALQPVVVLLDERGD
jgi:hypothetical protein